MSWNVPEVSGPAGRGAVPGGLFPEPAPPAPRRAAPARVSAARVVRPLAGGGVSQPPVERLTRCTVLVAGYVAFFGARQVGQDEGL